MAGRPSTRPATPSPETTPGDTVLELTFPVDALPTGDGVSAGLGYFSIPPGNSSTWISKCCRGPLIEYVVSGQYTVTVAAAIEVFRADGTVEQIPANTVATLGPGDSLLSRNETEAQAVNNGMEPVDIVQWTFVDESGDDRQFQGALAAGLDRWRRRRCPGTAADAAPADHESNSARSMPRTATGSCRPGTDGCSLSARTRLPR